MDEATLFKFSIWFQYGRVHPSKFPEKGVLWVTGSFKKIKPLSIFLERMKLRCFNLASGSTTASPTARVKNFPERGVGNVTLLKYFKPL